MVINVSDLYSSCCPVLRRLQLPPSWCGSHGSSAQPKRQAGFWEYWWADSWKSRVSACALKGQMLWGGLWKYGYSSETDPEMKQKEWMLLLFYLCESINGAQTVWERIQICLCTLLLLWLNELRPILQSSPPASGPSTCAGWEAADKVWGKLTVIEMFLCNVMTGAS